MLPIELLLKEKLIELLANRVINWITCRAFHSRNWRRIIDRVLLNLLPELLIILTNLNYWYLVEQAQGSDFVAWSCGSLLSTLVFIARCHNSTLQSLTTCAVILLYIHLHTSTTDLIKHKKSHLIRRWYCGSPEIGQRNFLGLLLGIFFIRSFWLFASLLWSSLSGCYFQHFILFFEWKKFLVTIDSCNSR